MSSAEQGGAPSAIALAATPWAERGTARLAKAHQEYLAARVRRSYWKVAGFRSDGDGIVIPYHNPDGTQMDGYARKRLLPAAQDTEGKEQKFSQPPGTKNRLYFAPGIDWVRRPPKHVFLGEGELRAAALAAHGHAALAIGGVWNFLTRDDGDEGTSKLIPDFQLLQLRDLAVTLVYDTDVNKKYQLQRALLRQAAILEGRGAKVDVLIVPDLGDGHTGIDDFVAAKGVDAALALPRLKLTDKFFLFWGAPTDPNPTDVGNAERFSDMHATQVRYVVQWKRWLVWRGHRWGDDETGEVQHRAVITSRRIYREASSVTDPYRRELLGKWATASESAARLRAMLEVASTFPEFATAASEFDSRPWLLAVANGVIDLQARRLEPGRPEWLLTKSSPVAYDPAARAPAWERFVEETFCGDAELVAYVRRVVGYLLAGDASEQCFFIFYGTGDNGKSTFVDTVMQLLGSGYAVKSQIESWVARQRAPGSATDDIARLAGARLVVAEEADEGERLAVARVKEVTGGDKIAARRLYEGAFEFTPQFKLIFVSNHKPIVPGDDPALWRRIRLVPFSRAVPAERRDKRLKDKLLRELPGVLNWALDGLAEWQRAGDLGMPAAIRDATAAYRSDSDLLGQFVAEECAVEDIPGHRRAAEARTSVDTTVLYKAYQAWTAERGYRAPRTMTWFSRNMQERDFPKQQGARHSRLVGVMLRDAAAGNFTDGAPSGKVADIRDAGAKKRGKF